MLKIQDLRNRVVVEHGEYGDVTKYWINEVRVEGQMLVFDVPYAETSMDGKTWQHAPDTPIQLNSKYTHMVENPAFNHPTKPSFVQYTISVRYGTDLAVLKEGTCLSDVTFG
jgi:hypothetical protein